MLHKRESRIKLRKGKIIQWAVFLFLLTYLLITLYNQRSLLSDARIENNNAEARLYNVTRENLSLQQTYASIGSREFVERVAREVFGFVHPEELIFIEAED